MKNNKLTLALSFVAIVLIANIACNKNTNSTIHPTDGPPADQTVTASLQGRVLDENGLPVKDAAVTSGTATASTDVNGVFTFTNLSMSSRFGFVKVVKQGYFTGSRSIVTNAGGANYVSIKLLPRSLKGSFTASAGGTVTVQTGNTVAFDRASVVTAATSQAYTGNVNVYATYLDPTSTDLPKQMPGDLRGIDTAGKETGLQSFGMMAVELQDDAGGKLQIASGKKATLTMAIPASLQATAPASIPLWYFNDSTGKWMEEGTAVRQGNNYVGMVGHFSYWNCDNPAALVSFKVRLKDQHGNPLSYRYIQFSSTTFGARGGYTDSSGYAQGAIPKGATFLFQVMDDCGNLIFGENVGPTLGDQDLGNPTVTLTSSSVTVSGTVVDCSASPVASGFVNVLLDGLNYRAVVTNGVFTLSINRCSSGPVDAELTAGDYGTLQQGSAGSVSINGAAVDAGQLSACGTSFEQFINVTINGIGYNLTMPPDSISYYTSQGTTNFWAIVGSETNNVGNIDLTFQNLTATGTYTPFVHVGTSQGHSYETPQGQNTVQCTVTSFGAVNGFVEGTLTGTLTDTLANTTNTMTGSFKIKRTN